MPVYQFYSFANVQSLVLALTATMCVCVLMWECLLPLGYFLLEPWDIKTFSHSPHFGVSVTIRDPNHEVLLSGLSRSQGHANMSM